MSCRDTEGPQADVVYALGQSHSRGTSFLDNCNLSRLCERTCRSFVLGRQCLHLSENRALYIPWRGLISDVQDHLTAWTQLTVSSRTEEVVRNAETVENHFPLHTLPCTSGSVWVFLTEQLFSRHQPNLFICSISCIPGSRQYFLYGRKLSEL